MKKGKKMSRKQRLKKAEKICSVYATGEYSVKASSEANGVSERTFHAWVKKHDEIAALYAAAQRMAEKKYLKRLKHKAKTALEKRVEGYTIKLQKQKWEYTFDRQQGKNVRRLVATEVAEKEVLPNMSAIIFALKNTDPDNFKDKQEVKVEQVNTGVKALPLEDKKELLKAFREKMKALK